MMLLQLVRLAFNFYSFLILGYCLLTWIPMSPGGLLHDLGMALDTLVGPYLRLFQRFIPPIGGLDLSPVVAIIALDLVENLVFRLLLGLVL